MGFLEIRLNGENSYLLSGLMPYFANKVVLFRGDQLRQTSSIFSHNFHFRLVFLLYIHNSPVVHIRFTMIQTKRSVGPSTAMDQTGEMWQLKKLESSSHQLIFQYIIITRARDFNVPLADSLQSLLTLLYNWLTIGRVFHHHHAIGKLCTRKGIKDMDK